jgi:uncharacterized protein
MIDSCALARRAAMTAPDPSKPRPRRLDATPATAAAASALPEPGFWAQVKQQLKSSLPSEADLARHRWLKPIAERLSDRALWRLKAEPVARGVAIGMFWAFVVPVAQIIFAAAHCVWWRGNIPVAAGVTMITNPLTVGGWLWLAYHVGTWLLPASAEAAQIPGAAAASEGWLAWIGSIGVPTLVGMGSFAVVGAALGYLLTVSGARLWSWWRFRSALSRRRQRQQEPRPD